MKNMNYKFDVEKETIYGHVEELIADKGQTFKDMIQEMYRSNDNLVCCTAMGVIDIHDLRHIIEFAFDAGRHSGASNP